MKLNTLRFKSALKAMSIHFGLSLFVAVVIALLVFTAWFPYPYRELAGGSELFMLVIAVDLVCGPLLTLVLYSPTKPKREMLTDISLIVVIQLLALCYGIWTVWQVRPLFVVQEADRLSIISRSTLTVSRFDSLPDELKPSYFGGPAKVSLRQITAIEAEKITSEVKAGGSDSAERPDLYVRFNGKKAYENGHPLSNLLITHPQKKDDIDKLVASSEDKDIKQLKYLYIVGRNFWLAVINTKGDAVGYFDPK